MNRKKITVSNLSQKNIAELIQLACLYDSNIFLEDSRHKINAKSLMGVMAFHPATGKSINIITSGADEHEALSAVENFLTR